MKFGLSTDELIARRAGLGGSDAGAILTGGAAWQDLWLDKTGRKVPKPIMSEWDAALRHCTERLQIEYYGHVTGNAVGRQGEVVVSSKYPFIRCTLDGFDFPGNRVLQAKHLSHWTKDAIGWAVEHYAGQVQHEMLACNVSQASLLILVGMEEPVIKNFEADPFWVEAYVERAREFWKYVETDVEPPGGPEPLIAPMPLADMTEKDMGASNSWCDAAGKWIASRAASEAFSEASKTIKGLVPKDVKLATGGGIAVSRAKNGSLTVRPV